MDVTGARMFRVALVYIASIIATVCPPSTTAQENPAEPGAATAIVAPDTLIEWDIPRGSLEEAAEHFSKRVGAQVSVNVDQGTLLVPIGPFRGLMTPRQMWSALMDAGCADGMVTKTGFTYSSIPKPIPGLTDRAWDYDLPRSRLVDMLNHVSTASGGILIGFMSTNRKDEETLIGPFEGRMTVHEVMLQILSDFPQLTLRWVERDMLSVEPRPRVPYEHDLIARGAAGELCRVRIPPSSRDPMVVMAKRLPTIGDDIAPVTVLDRKRIESLGVDSIPDLLRRLSQSAFMRGSGYRASGAQFAELRGIGAQYTLVLINGRRTFGSAADLWEGAFDLNTVPVSAVERVEILLDSPSLAHGSDSIGGTVNIVLRESGSETAAVRHQGASGGAGTSRGSISSGISTDTSSAFVALDYSQTTPLLGMERDRWRNQDFRRYGGLDFRSLYSAPPNVRTLDGTDLPGLTSPFAAVRIPNSGAPTFVGGEQNLTSLMRWASVVPELRRSTASAVGWHDFGPAVLRSELLYSDRYSNFQTGPEIIPEFILGAEHPQNPFGIPVQISAALNGLPPFQQEARSDLTRGLLHISSTTPKLKYEAYVLHSEENAKHTSKNGIDVARVIDALSGNGDVSLNVMTNAPGEGGQTFALSAPSVSRFMSGGTMVTAKLSGDAIPTPWGRIFADTGIEARREFAAFNRGIGTVRRDILSTHGRIETPAVHGLAVSAGIRRDDYENLPAVTSLQYAARWQPMSFFKLHASYSDSFHAPQLMDLFFPRIALPRQIYDPRRQEVASFVLLTGGNTALRPTQGRSVSMGLSLGNSETRRLSVELWSIKLKDRVSIVLPQALLASEDTAISGRIVRESPNQEDVAANRPGRLLSLDITRANLGRTETRGIDFSVETSLAIANGVVRPRFDATYTDEFRFSDTPSTRAVALDRAGIASELGTIPQWRLRGSLSFEDSEGWAANLVARHDHCYQDYIATLGKTTGRIVCPKLALDANISRALGKHIKLTLGASNITNSPPPFSEVNGPLGYDASQGDLVGRTFFLGVSGTLN